MENDTTHPALKNYSRPLEMGKHVVMQTLKSAVKWGAVLAVGALVLSAVPLIGPAIVASGVMNWALGGAALGAVIGAASGVAGMDEAADSAEERRMLAYSRNVQRAKGDAMFAAQMGQQMGGVSPQALGFGQGQSQGRNI